MRFDAGKIARCRSLPLFAIVLLVVACGNPASSASVPSQQTSQQEPVVEQPITIQILVDRHVVTGELEPSAAGRDFAALLPLEVTLRDHNRTEKIADLPQRLSIEGAADGADPVIGDIAYYAPWGNLAIYYRDFGYSPGLVRLGHLNGNTAVLAQHDGPVRIERLSSGAKGTNR
ncbi:cyclophilin-like fold protein [Novosphingobium sp. BW1]|uniref:cyclophilin-like fold protein n=1 Tax=Novosphingobium sp. BW1 TaxID=2592621 RepID=UPI0013969A06|nr:cyclophilin-like fold protein [Novosphingobium sp. BW1]